MAQIRKHARLALGITAAGVAGTAALLGPASAAQASGVNWDTVARCESGGNWGTNTGNGFYGGLQFTRGTWKSYGGTKYASTANKASKSEQIRIAEKVRGGQGIGAWPVCGRKAGSSKHYAGTHTSGSRSVTHKSTHRSTLERATIHTATTHRATTHRATARRATAPRVTRSTTVKATGKYYVVRSGDTLSVIATNEHIKGGWDTLYQLNMDSVTDPNLIFPGQRIAL